MAMKRVGVYWHLLPTFKMGRRIIWNGMDKAGKRFISAFPPEAVERKLEDEMTLHLKNGSIYQVLGTDKDLDSLVGANPVGVIFSEYSLQNPMAQELIQPILLENGGWQYFPYTPRGKNHGYTLFENGKTNPDWYVQKLGINDTGVMTDADAEEMRRQGKEEWFIQQELYCSFEASNQGAYYGQQMAAAQVEGRITQVPYDASLPVVTSWDLGYDDSTTIWFFQIPRGSGQIRVIDYAEHCGEGFPFYVQLLKEKGYHYLWHYIPHDINVHELGSGKTRLRTLNDMGVRDIRTVERTKDLQEDINAVRMMLSRCWFDSAKCDKGVEALKQYSKKWDEINQVYSSTPVHNQYSHGADGFRTFACGYRDEHMSLRDTPLPTHSVTEYDILNY